MQHLSRDEPRSFPSLTATSTPTMPAATARPSRSRTRMPSSPIITAHTTKEAQISHQHPQASSQPQSPTTTTTPVRTGRRSLSPIGGAANAMKKFLQRRRGATANGLVITGPFPPTTAPWTPPEAEDGDVNTDLPHTSFGQLGSGFYAEKQRGSSSSTSLDSPISISTFSPCLSPVSATSPKTATSFWGGMTAGRRGRQGRTVSVTMLTSPKATTAIPATANSAPMSTSSSSPQISSTSKSHVEPSKVAVSLSPETTPDNSTAAATTTVTSPQHKHHCVNNNTNIPYTTNNYNNIINNDISGVSSSRKKGFRRSLSADSAHSRQCLLGTATETILTTTKAYRAVHHDAETPLPAPKPKSSHSHKLLQLTSGMTTTSSTTIHKSLESNGFSTNGAMNPLDTQTETQDNSHGSSARESPAESADGVVFLLPDSLSNLSWVRSGKKRRAATANPASFSSSSSSSLPSSSAATTPSPAPRTTVTSSPSRPGRFPSGMKSPPYSPSSSTSSLPLTACMALGGSSSSTPSFMKPRPTRRQSESCLFNKVKGSTLTRGDGVLGEASATGAIRKTSAPLLSPTIPESHSGYSKTKESCPVTAMAEGKMLLISSHSSPTQFYDLPEARAKVRRFLTSLGGFEEVLEYGFPSDVAVEDTTDDSGGLGCRYLTLRLTLTPWHARADETELYGAPETQGKQQQFRTMMTKFFSRASSSGPLPGMVSGSSTAAPTPAPSPSPSSVHGSKGVASGAASPATVASHSGDSLYSSGKGLKTLAESDQELCSTGDIPSLCSREGLACTGNDDSMDSIVDLPVPCHPFENIGSPETHEAPTWALVGSIAASGGPRYPLSKSRATKSPPLVSASASHRGAASLPSKIPKPLKNRGFKMVNPSSTTAATNVMTQSATNIVMTSSTSSTTPSSVSASTTMTSSMEAAALAANALVTGQLPPLRSPPPRSVTPSRFMALPEIYQPPRKGSLTALSIPIAAASAGSGSASIYRSQLGAGGSALDMLTAPFMPARRKVSSPAIFNSPETRRQIGDDHYSSSAATNGSSSTHNLLQDGFRIRAHVSPSAPASPLHWPVYIPTGSTTTTTTKSTAADKEGDALTEAELIPVDGFAARSSKRSALDLQKSGLKPLSSSTSTTPPLVSSAASSPLPSPLLFPRTLGGAATPVQPQQPQQPPQPRGTAVPPPRPPRKRSDQLEKSPLAPAGAIAGDSVVSGKAATTVDAATTTEPKEGEDPPFEDVLLSKPLPPGALYKGSSSSPQRSAPTTTTSSSDPTVVDPLATTTATATVALRPQPVIQSDIFFETPAGLPNYQMDYVVPDLTLTPTPTPALSPTSTPAPAPALVATVAPVQVSNYVFGPPREPYQPRTRYIPNRRPTARQPMAIECTTTTSGTAAATLAKGTTAVVGDIPLQMRQEGNATVAELSHEGDGEGDDDDSDEGGDDDGDDDDDDDNSEDGQVWEMVTLPSTAPPLLSSSVSSGHIDASLARPHPTIDSPSPLSSLTRSPSNHHHRLSQAHRHQQQQPRRGIATASMVMAELRRPGQEPYVYGWSSVSNGAGVGNGSLDGSGLDPASFDEEDLIFGAYDYSYEDDGLHHHQSEQSLELQQEEDDEEDEEEGDEDGEEEGQVPTYATATTTMTTTTTSPLENVKEENDDEEEGEGDDNDEKKKKRRRRRMAMDARSETSEATTIYGQARIGIRMRAHHRTSHGDSHGGSVVTIRPHGQVVTVVGMAQAEGVGR